ncbi:hypothetical protein C1H46_003230 [Malus baccata]|uniref:F-box domain-containing protein n=1 Tax=Malus baccata TaxID=106549 RepID=A0A540NJL5_MALBA|nr:hypothetical protein C1H46_003230 [Malus baccata]
MKKLFKLRKRVAIKRAVIGCKKEEWQQPKGPCRIQQLPEVVVMAILSRLVSIKTILNCRLRPTSQFGEDLVLLVFQAQEDASRKPLVIWLIGIAPSAVFSQHTRERLRETVCRYVLQILLQYLHM